jgi:hypothetical protein
MLKKIARWVLLGLLGTQLLPGRASGAVGGVVTTGPNTGVQTSGTKVGNTWSADSGADLGTIISNAAAGDVITVRKGVYTVSNGILVGIGVTLRGEGLPLIKNFVDANGGIQGAAALNLNDNVIIEGFEVTNCISDSKFQTCIGFHYANNGGTGTNWIVRDCICHGDTDAFVLKGNTARVWGNIYDSIFLSKWDAVVLLAQGSSSDISCTLWNCASVVYTESVKTPGMSGYTHAIGYDGLGKGTIEVHGGYYASTNNSIGGVVYYNNGGGAGAVKTLIYGATLVGTNALVVTDVPSGSAGWQARLIGCNLDKAGAVQDLTGPGGSLNGPADIQIVSAGTEGFIYRETAVTANGAATGTTIMGDSINNGGGDTISALVPTASEGVMRRQTSDTTAGNDTGVSGNLNYRTGKNIYFKTAVKQDVIITKRFFYGLTDQTLTTMGGADNAAGNYAGFLLTTNISANKVLTITKDNSTQTSTTTTIVQDTGTTHVYEIIFDDAYPRVIFKIDGQVVATHTTHLPSAGTNLRYVIGGKKYDGTIRNTDIEYVRVRSLR